MGFKMKTPSITQGTKGHREAIKNIKLNRSMDNTSLPDGRPGSSPFQKTGSPNKDIDDRIARLTARKAAKAERRSDRATDKAARLTKRADIQTAKAGVAGAKGKLIKKGRKTIRAEKLRAKAAAYTPPTDTDVTEDVTKDVTKDITADVKEDITPKASLTTGTGAEKSAARAAYKGKESLPTYKSSYEKVKDKYENNGGGYDQYVKDAEAYWAKKEKEKSPTKKKDKFKDIKTGVGTGTHKGKPAVFVTKGARSTVSDDALKGGEPGVAGERGKRKVYMPDYEGDKKKITKKVYKKKKGAASGAETWELKRIKRITEKKATRQTMRAIKQERRQRNRKDK